MEMISQKFQGLEGKRPLFLILESNPTTRHYWSILLQLTRGAARNRVSELQLDP